MLTQAELAARSGVLEVTISRVENGHSQPTVKTIRRLADALEMDPVWLRFGEGDPEGKEAARVSLAA
jgi:transcriptional regulator with XRE-family HTH domain